MVNLHRATNEQCLLLPWKVRSLPTTKGELMHLCFFHLSLPLWLSTNVFLPHLARCQASCLLSNLLEGEGREMYVVTMWPVCTCKCLMLGQWVTVKALSASERWTVAGVHGGRAFYYSIISPVVSVFPVYLFFIHLILPVKSLLKVTWDSWVLCVCVYSLLSK